MPSLSSLTRFAPLRSVFGAGRSDLLGRLAQLSVLYEDLRLETLGIAAEGDQLSRLDQSDPRYRRLYFLRRSVATIFEFRRVLNKLLQTKEYGKAVAALQIEKGLREIIEQANSFLATKHELIKRLRNDVGGHFDERAAEFATRNVSEQAVGKLEITAYHSGYGAGPTLHFAGEIVATAFARSLDHDKPRDDELSRVIGTIRDCYEQASKAMHALAAAFLWERFQ